MILALDWIGGGIFGGGIAACLAVGLLIRWRSDTISERQVRRNARKSDQ